MFAHLTDIKLTFNWHLTDIWLTFHVHTFTSPRREAKADALHLRQEYGAIKGAAEEWKDLSKDSIQVI